MRKYLLLFLATRAFGMVMARVNASRHSEAKRMQASAQVRDTTLALSVTDDGLTPAAAAVPVGTFVTLEISCAGSRTRQLSLSGYEDHLKLSLAPHSTQRMTFFADRPGDDFAWLLDGQPVARLRVTGSHLVEGHR